METTEAMTIERACGKLVKRYFEKINPLDRDAVLDLFTEDGVVVRASHGMELKGREAISGFLGKSTASLKLYICLNLQIEAIDARSAKSTCLAMIVSTEDSAGGLPTGKFSRVLRYENEFAKTADGWRFSKLQVTRVIDNEPG